MRAFFILVPTGTRIPRCCFACGREAVDSINFEWSFPGTPDLADAPDQGPDLAPALLTMAGLASAVATGTGFIVWRKQDPNTRTFTLPIPSCACCATGARVVTSGFGIESGRVRITLVVHKEFRRRYLELLKEDGQQDP